MKLKSFTVERYRSIIAAKKVPVGRKTILVGPNNEGKSNILRALVLAMSILTREQSLHRLGQGTRGFVYSQRGYEWETDFPVRLQQQDPEGETVVVLEFELTSEELGLFRDMTGSRLSGTLPIQVAVGPRTARITVHKQGPGSAALSRKSDDIARFVTDRIDLQHIRAIRTAAAAEQAAEEMVALELDQLEDDPEYRKALARIEQLEQPVLDTLSESILRTLQQFLPKVKHVRVRVPRVARYRLRRECEIEVDDGTPTLLKFKGDGAQSLAALGIIRYAGASRAKGKGLVIAIEEPESHLHPLAIHELRRVIDELSEGNQVLLTTHNPLFVDRRTVANNVVVAGNRARPARSVEEIRKILGVHISDNLRHAELVLVVEGEDDRLAVSALLMHYSEALTAALKEGTLAIDTLSGASNWPYKLSLLRQALCETHLLLDDDRAGREAFENARQRGLAVDADVNFCIRRGVTESELEDLYVPGLYRDLLNNKYRVSLDNPCFRSKRKWSYRMAECFRSCGKPWNDRVEREVKCAIAEAVAAAPDGALNLHHEQCFKALVTALEQRLQAC